MSHPFPSLFSHPFCQSSTAISSMVSLPPTRRSTMLMHQQWFLGKVFWPFVSQIQSMVTHSRMSKTSWICALSLILQRKLVLCHMLLPKATISSRSLAPIPSFSPSDVSLALHECVYSHIQTPFQQLACGMLADHTQGRSINVLPSLVEGSSARATLGY